jgi:ABC-type nickel/cobalt efflux system permease component RcnA
MTSILFLGLLIGMKHALEADHIAAVASLAAGEGGSVRRTLKLGLAWGLGHTLTLSALGAAVLIFKWGAAAQVAWWAELLVGLMLVALGADVLWRLWRDRVHFHAHQHGATLHLHAHSHRGEGEHHASPHRHRHARSAPRRALAVGLMHGLAGSAALVLLTLDRAPGVAEGLAYMALFGLGSMAGMAALSVAIALPLRLSAGAVSGSYTALHFAVGSATIALGLATLYDVGFAPGGI